jgi:uncharacterized protein
MNSNKNITEFDWDEGNRNKPEKHNVAIDEAEEVFFDENKVLFKDWMHSVREKRFTLLGKTRKERLLNITYTIRKKKIRIITARDINRREVQLYEKAT